MIVLVFVKNEYLEAFSKKHNLPARLKNEFFIEKILVLSDFADFLRFFGKFCVTLWILF